MADGFIGYRRRVRVLPGDDRIDVDMEDDAHRFGVSLIHDGVTIKAVETRAPRYPWSTCPGAATFLAARMTGVALAQAAKVENQRDHCTHLYDLFVIAANHARDTEPLTYDVRVADARDGVSAVELDRNGQTILRWQLDASHEDAPDEHRGGRRALEAWTRSLPDELTEAGMILRRGLMVSGTRSFDFPVGAAAAGMTQMIGSCFTFSSGRAEHALREPDTVRDFSEDPDRLLSGDAND